MNKLLAALCILFFLNSCKKDQIPYQSVKGRWTEFKYIQVIDYPDEKSNDTVIVAHNNAEYIDFINTYTGNSNYISGFIYSLHTLVLRYNGGVENAWHIKLINQDTLTLTLDNRPQFLWIKYFKKDN
jgi:hypothetical protein